MDVIEAGNGFDGPTGSQFNSFLCKYGGFFVKLRLSINLSVVVSIAWGSLFGCKFPSTIDQELWIIRFRPELLDDHGNQDFGNG